MTACRGYRSEDHPYGIDKDEAAYISSMIKSERGFNWSITDTYYGNTEKEREASREFQKQVDKYPGLIEIMLGIEGLISGRSSHASGVYIYNHPYVELNAMMKAPNGSDVSQFDMDDSDYMGGLKFDYLTVQALDTMRTTIDILIEDGYVEEKGSIRETYMSILDPDELVDSKEIWDLAASGKVLGLFQFETAVGGDAIAKVEPDDLIEAAHVNSLMRLMPTERGGEAPTDKFVRFKNNISLWYTEMKDQGLNEEEVKVMEAHLEKFYGVAADQETLMKISMDPAISNFTLTQANGLRKAVAKKNPVVMEKVKIEFFECGLAAGTRSELLNYVWQFVAMPQAGLTRKTSPKSSFQ